MTKEERENILIGVPSNLRPSFEKLFDYLDKKLDKKVPKKKEGAKKVKLNK